METTEDRELYAHYVARGREPWNVSLEAAWLDYVLRSHVAPLLVGGQRERICNVGIGGGLWDDWLGHVAGRTITSVDIDADICRVFAIRQQRERHPHPARVLCGDVLSGVLGDETFDLITCVGSTLGESGDIGQRVHTLAHALAPGGCLVIATVEDGPGGVPRVAVSMTTR